jgi:hypothetical protein
MSQRVPISVLGRSKRVKSAATHHYTNNGNQVMILCCFLPQQVVGFPFGFRQSRHDSI